jgi:energy-coupling factor transporter ATP-binding protein EcfA2
MKTKGTNPFSTKFVQPGALAYQRFDGGNLEHLVDDFDDRCRGWASIIGPHGTGKSTLIASLKAFFEKSRPVYAYRLSTQERSSAPINRDRHDWKRGGLVIVDGYEQLSAWSSWRLRRWVKKRCAKLLVTGHQVLPEFSVLWRTSIDEELGRRLRNRLLDSRPDLLAREDLEEAWQRARKSHPTDMRETLFAMYDWVERIRVSQPKEA